VRLVLTSPLTSSSRSPISLLALLICHLSYATHYAGAKLSSPLHIEGLPEEDEVVKSWRYLEAVLVRRPRSPLVRDPHPKGCDDQVGFDHHARGMEIDSRW
jgi:hypothetical protein